MANKTMYYVEENLHIRFNGYVLKNMVDLVS